MGSSEQIRQPSSIGSENRCLKPWRFYMLRTLEAFRFRCSNSETKIMKSHPYAEYLDCADFASCSLQSSSCENPPGRKRRLEVSGMLYPGYGDVHISMVM
jgi:hypothetical protein